MNPTLDLSQSLLLQFETSAEQARTIHSLEQASPKEHTTKTRPSSEVGLDPLFDELRGELGL